MHEDVDLDEDVDEDQGTHDLRETMRDGVGSGPADLIRERADTFVDPSRARFTAAASDPAYAHLAYHRLGTRAAFLASAR